MISKRKVFTRLDGSQFFGGKISQRAVPDVEHPDHLASFFNLVKNAVDISPLPEEQAADLALCDLCFASKRAAVGQVFEGI